ncbi:MAG: FeoB-associated Cys-rich membrane protein [Eubacteriales bacterium]|nr:FeoB-associated Cys-rich membrane protein [Eubacteriales bacterium]
MGTAIVGGVLLLIVGTVVYRMVKDRKSGKHVCGGDCGRCKGCH